MVVARVACASYVSDERDTDSGCAAAECDSVAVTLATERRVFIAVDADDVWCLPAPSPGGADLGAQEDEVANANFAAGGVETLVGRDQLQGGCFELAEGNAAVKTPAQRDQLHCLHQRVREIGSVGGCIELPEGDAGPETLVGRDQRQGGCLEFAEGNAAVKTLAQRDQPHCLHQRVREIGPVGGCFELPEGDAGFETLVGQFQLQGGRFETAEGDAAGKILAQRAQLHCLHRRARDIGLVGGGFELPEGEAAVEPESGDVRSAAELGCFMDLAQKQCAAAAKRLDYIDAKLREYELEHNV